MKVARIVLRRLAHAVPVLFIVSIGIFGLMYLLPGDPAVTLAGGDAATPESIAAVRARFGLNDPFVTRYVRWLGHALRFDFGTSLQNARPVRQQILERIPASLSLAGCALVVTICVGFALGLLAGTRSGTIVDRVASVASVVAVAVPSFVLAIVLVRVLAIEVNWLPAVGYVPLTRSPLGWLKSIVMPSLALSALGIGGVSRQLRAGLVGTLRSDYVRTAWAIGGGSRSAVGKHALRNAAGPAVATVGATLAFLIGGTVIIEQIFAINGVGSLMFNAALANDVPMLQGVVIWFALVQLVAYLATDVALAVLNPRIAVG